MRSRLVEVLLPLALLTASAATQAPPHNGPRPVDPGWFALVGGRVVPRPGAELPNATVVLRDGEIVAVGADVTAPAGATVIDCTGLSLYPGLIEPYYPSDVPALPDDQSDKHWSTMVQPQRSALDGGLVATKDREQLRALGFTTVAATPSGGILKGTSTVVLLDEPTATDRARIVRDRAFTTASLQTARGDYPGSEMGAVALLRQSLADGRWYDRCRAALATEPSLADDAPAPSRVLAAIADQQQLPLWCDASNELQALRLLKIAAEFDRDAVVVGSGMEFRRLPALRERAAPLVVPLHLPEAPDVTTAALAATTTLRQLQSWEIAPSNSKRLLDAGLVIAWTTARLPEKKAFAARVRDALAHGVTETQALAALTTTPAKLLGIERRCGEIATGKLANLVVCDGSLFAADTTVREVWVGGVRHRITEPKDRGLDGSWSWAIGWPGARGSGVPSVVIDGDKLHCKVGDQALEVRGMRRDATALTCRLAGERLGVGTFWLRLHVEADGLRGVITAPSGEDSAVMLRQAEAAADDDDAEADEGEEQDGPGDAATRELPTPLGGYGFTSLPEARPTVLTNATLWPCDGRGVIHGGALLMRAGKIVFAGPGEQLPELPADVVRIDATGKHVTPGIIDCHSHTGISRGVNEGGQAVTSEVRIQDVLDPDDVNWYRQLAGGVTTVNQLHGSANVIGGQSNTVKIRYGVLEPDEMRFDGARDGIKFALGENPRRVNGRSGANPRYPNTRMGVEALLRDRFAAAEAYAREHRAYLQLAPRQRAAVLPPRTDLELEAIAEVLAGQRWIHCHSYRQDEIFMLCQLVTEYGFKVGTFQHVLEGYKVADAIREAAVGASSFTDWWAYKLEVYDAIPDNGAILHEQGVVTSFNSDSNELARRLNTEAGKAVKYGGVAPAEALMFVTRNPAIQLGIDDRTGSLVRGKDADVVLWSHDPLSYAAICERTWVDGREMFSLERDRGLRQAIASERERLLQRALKAAGKNDGKRGGARRGDPRDAYWAAEDLVQDYCCRTTEGRK